MKKIVLDCQNKDEELDSLIKCLKHLFPECSLTFSIPGPKEINTGKNNTAPGIME